MEKLKTDNYYFFFLEKMFRMNRLDEEIFEKKNINWLKIFTIVKKTA